MDRALSRARRVQAAALTFGICAACASSAVDAAQPAQPTYNPPYAKLDNVLYVVPYAVSTQPFVQAGTAASFPDAETIITIGGVKKGCNVQVEWINWDGSVVGYSGAITTPPPLLPTGSLQFHTQSQASPPLPAMPPYVLNVLSNFRSPFEGRANIRSNCSAATKLQVDAGFEVVLNANSLPRYKRTPVVRPTGNTGG